LYFTYDQAKRRRSGAQKDNNLGIVAAQQPSGLDFNNRLTHFGDRDGALLLI
jgi:hypothetical protein